MFMQYYERRANGAIDGVLKKNKLVETIGNAQESWWSHSLDAEMNIWGERFLYGVTYADFVSEKLVVVAIWGLFWIRGSN